MIREGQDPSSLFFAESKVGKRTIKQPELEETIIALREKNLAITDIKAYLSSRGIQSSLWKIDKILKTEKFPPLPRRSRKEKEKISIPKEFSASEAEAIDLPLDNKQEFESLSGGVFLFYPLLKELNIEKLVEGSGYPETKQISRLQSILSFLALKLSDTKRLSHSDDYCFDRGLGLFAGLNVLPKNAWFGSYSYRINREMNLKFLSGLNRAVEEIIPASGDFNLDFTTIPHWGDESVLERNWSNKRHVGLKSMLALLVQDQGSRLLKYGDCEIKHADQSDVILEFVDFYRKNGGKINCLIFDSKFTTYHNLSLLNKDRIKFLTLRRRSKKMVEKMRNIEKDEWQRVKLNKNYKRKYRNLLVYESKVKLTDYEGEVRQIVITNNGRIEPTFLITNDFEISLKQAVLKYARRWLIEKSIAEQIDCFHLNRLSSSIVVKVDFDLTMTIFAHTVYKLFSSQIPGFENTNSDKISRNFIKNYARIKITDWKSKQITITLNKKVSLPLLYETDWFEKNIEIPWLNDYKIKFEIGTTS
ncbi:MAG: transposase [Candidatus Marinimicrobia bacterium]|nr:transposase [bacterium]MCG2716161.1 transposase [Candidatus Neomarinimicrobiota bacterium]